LPETVCRDELDMMLMAAGALEDGTEKDSAHGRLQFRTRSDLHQSAADAALHRTRRDALLARRGVGLPRRLLFLLHHAQHDRFRRLRTGDKSSRGLAGPDGAVCTLSARRSGAAGHVLRPHAGGGPSQVPRPRY